MNAKFASLLPIALVALTVTTDAAAVTGTVSEVTTTTAGTVRFKLSGSSVLYLIDQYSDPYLTYQANTQIALHGYTSAKTLTITTHDCATEYGSSWCFVSLISF